MEKQKTHSKNRKSTTLQPHIHAHVAIKWPHQNKQTRSEYTADKFGLKLLIGERDAVVASTETADCQKRRVARCCGANKNVDKNLLTEH